MPSCSTFSKQEMGVLNHYTSIPHLYGFCFDRHLFTLLNTKVQPYFFNFNPYLFLQMTLIPPPHPENARSRVRT